MPSALIATTAGAPPPTTGAHDRSLHDHPVAGQFSYRLSHPEVIAHSCGAAYDRPMNALTAPGQPQRTAAFASGVATPSATSWECPTPNRFPATGEDRSATEREPADLDGVLDRIASAIRAFLATT